MPVTTIPARALKLPSGAGTLSERDRAGGAGVNSYPTGSGPGGDRHAPCRWPERSPRSSPGSRAGERPGRCAGRRPCPRISPGCRRPGRRTRTWASTGATRTDHPGGRGAWRGSSASASCSARCGPRGLRGRGAVLAVLVVVGAQAQDDQPDHHGHADQGGDHPGPRAPVAGVAPPAGARRAEWLERLELVAWLVVARGTPPPGRGDRAPAARRRCGGTLLTNVRAGRSRTPRSPSHAGTSRGSSSAARSP